METIVVSIPGNYPGFAFADKVYKLDTRDQEAVLRAAQSERLTASVLPELMWQWLRLAMCVRSWGCVESLIRQRGQSQIRPE